MSGRDDRDTRELLDELATTLDALRADLDDGNAREGRRGPPTPRELLRVTEAYTIPAVIASLEAAIAALELLRAVLRLADPDRAAADESARGSTDVMGRAGESAVVGAERALSELRRALSAADLPEDRATDLAADARALSAEVESRLRAARDAEPSDGDAADGRSDGVQIDVEAADTSSGNGDDAPDDAGVDVDAELESIRRDVRGDTDEEVPDREGDEATDASGQDDDPARSDTEDGAGRESDPGRADESDEHGADEPDESGADESDESD
jgi:hypothetical protein